MAIKGLKHVATSQRETIAGRAGAGFASQAHRFSIVRLEIFGQRTIGQALNRSLVNYTYPA